MRGHKPSEKELANLRPFNTMPEDERKRINSNGGKKSGQIKREKKKCAEILKILVDKVYRDKSGNAKDGREVLMVSLFNQAVKNGKIDAMKLILSMLGEMPTPELAIKESVESDNGILDKLLSANLKLQKQKNRGNNAKTGTESADANC